MLTEWIVYLISGFSCLILSVSSGHIFPQPISAAQEKELFHKLRTEGDCQARTKLIEHNLRLVAHIVRKYYTAQTGQEDLISIGTIGLIKAIDTFNDRNGARFATYAAKCIQNEILMYFRSQKKINCEVSINETIDTDREGNPLTYIDIIHVDDTIAEDIDEKWKLRKMLRYIKENLSERERQIIIMRYGLGKNPPVTQREVADCLGISRSYVSRIEKNALEQMHQYLSGRQ